LKVRVWIGCSAASSNPTVFIIELECKELLNIWIRLCKKQARAYLQGKIGVINYETFKKEKTMKKLFVVVLALMIALTAVGPAFAAGNPRGNFTLVGRISAIDPVSGAVTVSVIKGNKLVQPYLKQDLVMTTTAKTRYLYKSSTTAPATPITFADLKVGNAVSVNGTVANGVWAASRITVGAKLTCLQ
jgi:hypothetical protein